MHEESPVVIAYYPLRARAQIPRLLCEYLHIPYVDRFFTPAQWTHFKKNEAKDWVIRDIPFLQDGEFTVVGAVGIVTYLLEREKRTDMLGRTIQDKAKFDNMRSRCDIQAAIIGTLCMGRSNSEAQSIQQMLLPWEKRILPILIRHEEQCQLAPWFFSSISIMDFIVYEIINQVDLCFPQEAAKFKKLYQIRDKLAKIPEIEAYQKSQRAVKEFSPLRFFSLFKEERIKRSKGSSSASSTSSRSSNNDMDIQ